MSKLGKKIEKFEFGQNSKNKYPWKDWTNGQIWQIKQGEQFTCSMLAMKSSLSCKASRDERTVQYEKTAEGELTFQFS